MTPSPRKLYVAYDGRQLAAWWDHFPGSPPAKGKKWPVVGPPDVYLKIVGRFEDIMAHLKVMRILPDSVWSTWTIDLLWAERGMELAAKAQKPVRKAARGPEGGLFADALVGKVAHQRWGQ